MTHLPELDGAPTGHKTGFESKDATPIANEKEICYTMDGEQRAFWVTVRQAVLLVLDALERRLEIQPRTSDLRRQARAR
jgi:hypothetical protein